MRPALRDQIVAEARAAFPRECCGLIEGVREDGAFEITALHPTRNLAYEPDRFLLDPAEHMALRRRLRGTGRQIIGCYHSHPDGRAVPSVHDQAFEDGFLWLIAALDMHSGYSLAAYVPKGGSWDTIALSCS
ncbi:MAG TPA: M67 family metallopeptidase [Rhizomicrobium sp.]